MIQEDHEIVGEEHLIKYAVLNHNNILPESLDDNIREMVGEEHEMSLAVLNKLFIISAFIFPHCFHKVSSVAQLNKVIMCNKSKD